MIDLMCFPAFSFLERPTMTGSVTKLFKLQYLTLYAAIEAFLVAKFLPQWVPEKNALAWAFLPLLILNYTLHTLFWGLLYPYLFSPLRNIPEPKSLSARLFYFCFMGQNPPGEHFLKWSRTTPNNGILLLRSPFFTSRLLVTNPRALADLLNVNAYDFVKPKTIRDFLRKVLGDGLIVVEGDIHKFQRKHTMPAFSFRHVKDLYPMMWRKAIALTEALEGEIRETHLWVDEKGVSGTTEINAWASKVTLDIIGLAGMGTEFNVLKNVDHQIVRDYEELLEPTGEKLLFFLSVVFLGRKAVLRMPWGLNEVFERCTSSLSSICEDLVRQKRQALKSGSKEDHFDILSVLIRSDNFSDRELADQLLTFLAAGHETTSSAFTWATYLLAAHPDYQRRLREEIRAALPPEAFTDPSFDIAGILERLPLLNGVCNETVRLYPTVPITTRIAKRDTTIAGHPIPRGTEIFLSPWAVNRSPDLWGPQAEKFIPERWIDNANPSDHLLPPKPNNHGGAASNYALLTFLHGPRSCIGQNFAKAELRCLVAALAERFEWDLDMKGMDVLAAGVITIKPRNGLHVRLRRVYRE